MTNERQKFDKKIASERNANQEEFEKILMFNDPWDGQMGIE
jgi:hypothetical protein